MMMFGVAEAMMVGAAGAGVQAVTSVKRTKQALPKEHRDAVSNVEGSKEISLRMIDLIAMLKIYFLMAC
jgi:hypothetical protein